MLDDFGSAFMTLGPVIILAVGTLATIGIAVSVSTPSATLWVLALGPAVSLVVAWGSMFMVARLIDPADGSGFLLGGAPIALYIFAAHVYYPVLALVAIWRVFRA